MDELPLSSETVLDLQADPQTSSEVEVPASEPVYLVPLENALNLGVACLVGIGLVAGIQLSNIFARYFSHR